MIRDLSSQRLCAGGLGRAVQGRRMSQAPAHSTRSAPARPFSACKAENAGVCAPCLRLPERPHECTGFCAGCLVRRRCTAATTPARARTLPRQWSSTPRASLLGKALRSCRPRPAMLPRQRKPIKSWCAGHEPAEADSAGAVACSHQADAHCLGQVPVGLARGCRRGLCLAEQSAAAGLGFVSCRGADAWSVRLAALRR